MTSDQQLLQSSQAGLRLIAVLTLLNNMRYDRLRAYFREHLAPAALEEAAATVRLAEVKMLRGEFGRLRARQVIGADKHHVICLFDGEHGGLLLIDLACEEDYPHKISALTFARIQEESAAPENG